MVELSSNSLDYEELWKEVIHKVKESRKQSIADILTEFLGFQEKITDFTCMSYLHHVAVYLGDYTEEQTIDLWDEYLLAKVTRGDIVYIDRGPSYIAPKYYGIPGWWFSTKLRDGFVVEMFCCRDYGSWSKLSVDVRENLMSHKAIFINSEDKVLSTLKYFEQKKNIELIAFTERDELGHTYGHLRNNMNSRVLELVHSNK